MNKTTITTTCRRALAAGLALTALGGLVSAACAQDPGGLVPRAEGRFTAGSGATGMLPQQQQQPESGMEPSRSIDPAQADDLPRFDDDAVGVHAGVYGMSGNAAALVVLGRMISSGMIHDSGEAEAAVGALRSRLFEGDPSPSLGEAWSSIGGLLAVHVADPFDIEEDLALFHDRVRQARERAVRSGEVAGQQIVPYEFEHDVCLRFLPDRYRLAIVVARDGETAGRQRYMVLIIKPHEGGRDLFAWGSDSLEIDPDNGTLVPVFHEYEWAAIRPDFDRIWCRIALAVYAPQSTAIEAPDAAAERFRQQLNEQQQIRQHAQHRHEESVQQPRAHRPEDDATRAFFERLRASRARGAQPRQERQDEAQGARRPQEQQMQQQRDAGPTARRPDGQAWLQQQRQRLL